LCCVAVILFTSVMKWRELLRAGVRDEETVGGVEGAVAAV
jgi:hypothetical protein